MLVARQEVLTQSLDLSGGPEGRDQKGAYAALQSSPRTTSLGLRPAPCICALLVAQRAFAIILWCPDLAGVQSTTLSLLYGFEQVFERYGKY